MIVCRPPRAGAAAAAAGGSRLAAPSFLFLFLFLTIVFCSFLDCTREVKKEPVGDA
jgi:hypothetical protein